ncbi:hypothetical protein ACOMHN_005998 [Nucella lapillus]
MEVELSAGIGGLSWRIFAPAAGVDLVLKCVLTLFSPFSSDRFRSPACLYKLTVGGVLSQAATLVARVSVGGVKGSVTLQQASPGQQVTVNVSLSGPNVAQAATWQLHSFRVNYDVSNRCDVARLGPRILTSVSGPATNGDQTKSGLELSGMNSIEGRSIVFLNTGGTPIACANVESTGDYVTARATFRKTVLGDVIFRQQISSLTRVTVDLYSDGTESTVRDLEWRVVDGGGCEAAGTPYNPASVTVACSSSNHASCAVGDLSGKLGGVKMAVTMGGSRKTSADLNLPLSGSQSVQGKNLQLFVSGQSTPVACATIYVFSARTGIATFDSDGVTGTITLTQPSPLDPATTVLDLKNLRSKAGGYHVHKYPVPQRLSKDDNVCSGAMVAGHFNPFGVIYDASSPAAATTTEDAYEVGDLSKKYGLLSRADAKSATYTDLNLQLFGTNSVLGRSIVIHYDQPDAPRWVCANLHDTAALTSALATFTFPVIGHVLLQQRVGEGEEAETSVYYRLDYGDGVTGATTGHSWGLHVNAVNRGMLFTNASRCASAGDVINPLGVNATNYVTQCQTSNPLRCNLGDLKGKHGAVSVRTAAGTPAIGFFTDVSLPLQGSQSVLGKSVVLKASGGGSGALACANLLKVWPQVVLADTWGGQKYGTVTFSQQVGVVQAPTTISLDLKYLSVHNMVVSTISNKPVASGGNRCASLGGVYNPYEVTSPGTTKDKIAVGDLAAKFGSMAGTAVSGITWVDPSLDVWGPRAVTGRAISLSDSGRTVGCAALQPKMVSGGRLFKARAVFTGEVLGDIMLTQYVYPDGAMTPTTVVVSLQKAAGAQTLLHNWHTHVKPVLGDAASTPGRCQSTGGHYNPFAVNVMGQYGECKLSNPLRCELGDQSNKLGPYDMGSGPRVSNDVYLPLTGPYGVIGRSFVVHTENRGAPRLACADILPYEAINSYSMWIKTPPTLDKAPMVQAIAMSIGTEPYNIAVDFLLSNNTEGCQQTLIYFLGKFLVGPALLGGRLVSVPASFSPCHLELMVSSIGLDAESNKQKFNNVIGGDPIVLGDYQPAKQCPTASVANAVLMSLFLLTASLFLGRALM